MNCPIPIARSLDDKYKLAIIDLEKDMREYLDILRAKAAYEKGMISHDEFREIVLKKEK